MTTPEPGTLPCLQTLLGRVPRPLDDVAHAPTVVDRRVLITGAAGSIGSALVEAASRLGAAELLLVDRRPASPLARATFVRADLADPEAVAALDLERIQVTFHAAALKHLVPLERDPWSAFAVNTIATLNVLERLPRDGTFVFVSTDKAADPTSVLGASKLLAERVAAAAGAVTVRLANVVDSDGSLLPRVRRALELGRPFTLRDPSATRFLLTVEETVSSLLEAARLGAPGETFVPRGLAAVTVADMVTWAAGGAQLRTRRTRLGPGEKKVERLVATHETRRAATPGLDRVISETPVPPIDVLRLREAVAVRDGRTMADILHAQIPGWSPSPWCSAALAGAAP